MVTAMVNGGQTSWVVDTGATVSVVKPGIIKGQMCDTMVKATGVTGDKLDVKGTQEIELRFANGDTYRHQFVVCPIEINHDGILGLDFMVHNRVNIDVLKRELLTHTGRIGLTDNPSCIAEVRSVEHGLIIRKDSLTSQKIGNRSDSPHIMHAEEESSLCLRTTPKFEEIESTCYPVYCAHALKIPPRSETVFLVNVSDRFTTERKSSLKNKIETTVIFEPDELGSNGVYFARVLNSVKGTDFKNKSVQLPVKVRKRKQSEA